MKRFFLLPFALLFLSGAAAAQDWNWRVVSARDGSWRVNAPGPLTPDKEAEALASKKGSYSYNDFYGYFGVVYRDAKESVWTLKPDHSRHYKKVRDDFIKASRGELLSEEKFASGDVAGRNVRIKIPVGQMTDFEGKSITKYRIERLRMFFVGNRFYLLVAVLPADIVDTPNVDKFFDSFSAN
ncbi:MAG: hypothetical protein JSS81_06245 [Acidobacteria bacterium]|nr:hypothetical protein [Acidobacteriota bacterium]